MNTERTPLPTYGSHGAGTTYFSAGALEHSHVIVPSVEKAEQVRKKPMISRRFADIALHDVAKPAAAQEPEKAEVKLDDESAHLAELFHFRTQDELIAMKTDVMHSDPRERSSVTEESEQAAVGAFIGASADVKRIVDDAMRGMPLIGRDKLVPEFLRSNDDVRIQLGAHLLDKIDEISDLPDKIGNNWSKLPNAPGYARMQSRDYVAVLALAMLDGTFKPDLSRLRPVAKRPDGTFDDGTYRDTAQKLLRQGSSF